MRILGFVCLVLVLVLGVVADSYTDTLFCGKENCYQVLGLKRDDAKASQIKKNYRSLSLEWHPDRNKSEEAKKEWLRLSNAYEILSNETKREEYHDFLDHPENWARGGIYAAKSEVGVVVFGLLAVATALHYLNMRLNHNRFVQRIKQSSHFKESVARLVVAEKAADPKQAEKILLEQIEFPKHGKKPQILDLLPFQIIKLPYVIGMACFEQIRWQVRYTWLKKEYTAEDEIIAIRMVMNLTESQWEQCPEKEREEMIERQVWDDKKREEYLRDKTIEENRKGGGMRKRVNRMKKNYVPPPVMEGDM